MNSFNDPLLFIKAPPVFHLPPNIKVNVPVEVQMDAVEEVQDESTSIYEIRTTMSKKTLAILEKLHFLSKPFQRKAYRPLVFHMEGGIYLQGEVADVDDDVVTLIIGEGEIVTYPVNKVEKIVWRGVEMK